MTSDRGRVDRADSVHRGRGLRGCPESGEEAVRGRARTQTKREPKGALESCRVVDEILVPGRHVSTRYCSARDSPSQRWAVTWNAVGREVDAISRDRDIAVLARVSRALSVEIHADPTLRVIHVHVGRGDVVPLALQILDPQRAGSVDSPRTRQAICEGQPDRTSAVVRKVEVVAAQPVREPFGRKDRRRTVEVTTLVTGGHTIQIGG